METLNTKLLEVGVSMRPLPGEAESGDHYVVKANQNGAVVAVIDGLGHGTEAADAAKLAVSTLVQYANETAISLVRRCHAVLLGTRGVVMSLACFSSFDDTMTWVGVGNVEGLLLRADAQVTPGRESLLLRGGVIGGSLPGLRATVLPVSRRDTLVFVTDGLTNPFASDLNFDERPQVIANRMMERYSKGTDDALVLVARYLGQTR